MNKRQKIPGEKNVFLPGKTCFKERQTRKVRKKFTKMNSSLESHERARPDCGLHALIAGRFNQPLPVDRWFAILIVIINILAFPVTTVLNALVMMAVKVKARLRVHKSNILLAALASTDFVVGLIVQPVFIATAIITLLNETSGVLCALQVITRLLTSCVSVASLIHLSLISGERFLAMKYPFSYTKHVTAFRVLIASSLGWLISVMLHILVGFVRPRSKFSSFSPVNGSLIGLMISFIVFCHVKVYRETGRHKKQLAAQQVTQEAREQFERDKKALKLTSIIVCVLMLCYIPFLVSRFVLSKYRGEIFYFFPSLMLLNSLFNPIIYSVKMRQFRVAFIELTCKTLHITEAEEIEVRLFGGHSTVVTLEGQEYEGQNHHTVERVRRNNNETRNDISFGRHENVLLPGTAEQVEHFSRVNSRAASTSII